MMGVFTTNWYLYKTHFNTNSGNPENQRSQMRRRYGQKTVTTDQTLKWVDNEF